MALLTAQFAMGVVAVSALNNPTIIAPGDQPQDGVRLNISGWKYVSIILGLTGGLQLVLFLITAFVANRVVVSNSRGDYISSLRICLFASRILSRIDS
jgi:hypothetical protein